MKIIAICGLIGSGKDTIADYLCNFYHFKRDSFASTLKDSVACVFGWDRELLEGRTKYSREWREQVDHWWAQRLSMPNLTPRFVLQNWGTEVCRVGFHDDIWIASLENRIRTSKDNIVITDCRFPNEIQALKRLDATIVRVKRGSDPDWFQVATQAPELMKTAYPKIHASEYSWASTKFDVVVDNNGSIEDLYNSVKNLV